MTHILFSAARERRLTRVSVIATAALLGGTLAAPGLTAATAAPTAPQAGTQSAGQGGLPDVTYLSVG